jgi:ADP-ribose pyrophosphatase YjhB (NUDIX family)
MPHHITPSQQLAELTSRVTPILNVDAVVFRRKDPDDTTSDPEFLVGHRNPQKYPDVVIDERLFPGGHMHYDETPQEAAHRILEKELPGVQAHFKKIIAAQPDRGYDHRAYGVTIYYLFEYISGEPEQNQDFDAFKWMDEETMRNREKIGFNQSAVCSALDVSVTVIQNRLKKHGFSNFELKHGVKLNIQFLSKEKENNGPAEQE